MVGKWLVMEPIEGDVNIIPDEDSGSHIESRDCPCRPRIQNQSKLIQLVIHNSFDLRELAEWPQYGSSAN